MTPRKWLDIISLSLFVLGSITLIFAGGMVGAYYELPPTKTIQTALENIEAWKEKQEALSQTDFPGDLFEEAVHHKKITWNKELTAAEGYTLIAIRYSTTAFLVNMKGEVVYKWEMPFRKAWPRASHVEKPVAENRIYFNDLHVFPNGDLLANYTAWGDTPYGYGLVKMDKDSNILWTYDAHVHHEFYVDKQNGNIYLLTHEFLRRPVEGLPYFTFPALADYVVTLSPEGKELNKIPLAEAFRDSPYASLLYHEPIIFRWDVFHTNSIEKLEPEMAKAFPLFQPGDILLSIRNMNALAVVNPQKRKIVWAAQGPWNIQHSARFLENGRLLVFDNEGLYAAGRKYSRALEYDPNNQQITWEYRGGPNQHLYSYAYGRIQRLPNGNTLIAETLGRRILEITSEGKIAWEFRLPKRFIKLDTNMPPYKRHIPKTAFHDPIFSNTYKILPNLATAIINATRYDPQELPFLKEANDVQ